MPTLSSRDGTGQPGQQIVQDSSGNVYVIYSAIDPMDGYGIFMKTSLDSYSAETTLSIEGGSGVIAGLAGLQTNQPCVTIVQNKLHMIFKVDSNPPGFGIYHTVLTDLSQYTSTSAWKKADLSTNGATAILTASPAPGGGHLQSLAADSLGGVYCIYNHKSVGVADYGIFTSKWTSGSGWDTPIEHATVASDGVFGGTSIVVDSNNFIHIAFGSSSQVYYGKMAAAAVHSTVSLSQIIDLSGGA
jgi:hypothetical protein